MVLEGCIAGASAVVAAALVIFLFKRKGKSERNTLRRECRRLLKLPTEAAEDTIDRHIKSLQARFPGRSEEWYLEKILYDLERDR